MNQHVYSAETVSSCEFAVGFGRFLRKKRGSWFGLGFYGFRF